VHIVDISGSEGRDPKEDFNIINDELKKFNPELAERPMLVAGNKCDLASEEQVADFKSFVEKQGYDFFPIMAAIRYQIDPLLNRITEMLSKLPPVKQYEPEAAPLTPIEEIGHNEVKITNNDGVFIVEGEWLVQVINSVNFDDYESLQYFQRVLINSGVIDALREAGIQEGDTVSIYEIEFDFVE
jgi:GTP-binding protein